MTLPPNVRADYFELAKNENGTSGEILTKIRAFARSHARELMAQGHPKREIATAFEELAAECYAVACEQKWFNDYALNLAETVRQAVMSVQAK